MLRVFAINPLSHAERGLGREVNSTSPQEREPYRELFILTLYPWNRDHAAAGNLIEILKVYFVNHFDFVLNTFT
jgi:hypothetical protein